MSWEPLNLSAVRGSNKPIVTIDYWHTVVLSEPVKAGTTAAPITEIFVTPIPIEIPDGTKLKFVDPEQDDDCTYTRFVTVGVTAPNSDRIEVEPYIGLGVPCEYVADVAPIDLTGRTYSASVRREYEDTTPLFSLTCTVNALAGAVELSAAATTVTPNAKFFEIPNALDELQEVTAESKDPAHKRLVKNAYHWDLEYSELGENYTEAMGFFWLIWEATR